jgi:hypothetical protein
MKIKNLIQFPLTKAQYYPEVHPKKQIVLHHTAVRLKTIFKSPSKSNFS